MKGGAYEVINGQLTLTTQAIAEAKGNATFRSFDDVVEAKVIPIAQACAKCDFWKRRNGSRRACRERQGRDARARGFTQVICAKQFVNAQLP